MLYFFFFIFAIDYIHWIVHTRILFAAPMTRKLWLNKESSKFLKISNGGESSPNFSYGKNNAYGLVIFFFFFCLYLITLVVYTWSHTSCFQYCTTLVLILHNNITMLPIWFSSTTFSSYKIFRSWKPHFTALKLCSPLTLTIIGVDRFTQRTANASQSITPGARMSAELVSWSSPTRFPHSFRGILTPFEKWRTEAAKILKM